MKKLTFLSLFLLIYITSNAQSPDTLWTRLYNVNNWGSGESVQQTAEGGFIICGSVMSSDIWLIRTDASGDTLWSRTFDSGGWDAGRSVQQTFDGGFILMGLKDAFGPDTGSVWLIRTDQMGDTVWTKSYGGDYYDVGCDMQQTPDEGYIISGITGRNAWLIKTDAMGDTIWTKIYPNILNEANSLDQTSDGGYILTGGNFNDSKIGLIKTDSLGDTLWTKTYLNGSGSSVIETSDSGYIVTGYDFDQWALCLIKTDLNGNTEWIKSYPHGQYWESYGNSVQQTSDGGYVVAGYQSFNGMWHNLLIFRTDSDGDTAWTKTSEEYYFESVGRSIQQTTDNGYIIAGTRSNPLDGSLWLIRLEADPVNIENETYTPLQFGILQNYPNPFNPATRIRYSLPRLTRVQIKVYDILANEVALLVNEEKPAGTYDITWNAANLPSGIYFYQIIAGEFVQTKKMVFLK